MKATANSKTPNNGQQLTVPPLDGFKRQPAHKFGDAFAIQPRRKHMGPPAGMEERRHVMYSGRTDHIRLAEKREKEAAQVAALAAQAKPAPAPQVPPVAAPQAEPLAQAGELLARALVRALAETFGPALARQFAALPLAEQLAAALVPQAPAPAPASQVAAPAPQAQAPRPAALPVKPAADIGRAPAQETKGRRDYDAQESPDRSAKGPAMRTNGDAFAEADKRAAEARKGPGKAAQAPAPAPAPYVPPASLVAAFEAASKAEQTARITPAQAPQEPAQAAEAAEAATQAAELAELAELAERGELEKLRRAAHAQAANAGAKLPDAERRAMRKQFAELDVRLNSEEFDDPASWKNAIDWEGSGHSKKYQKIFEWCLLKGLSSADAHNISAIKSYGLAKAKLV